MKFLAFFLFLLSSESFADKRKIDFRGFIKKGVPQVLSIAVKIFFYIASFIILERS